MARLLVAALSLSMLAVATWMTTYGTWRVFDPEDFGNIADAQAQGFLLGRLDIPINVIRYEAYLHEGKAYTIFGPTPALFRVPLELFLPDMSGRWARAAVLATWAVALLYACNFALLVLKEQPEASFARGLFGLCLFLVLIGLGSPLMFPLNRPWAYHEVILWAAACTMGCFYHLTRYCVQPRHWHLVAAIACNSLALFSKATFGTGTMLALSILGGLLLLPRTLWEKWRQLSAPDESSTVRAEFKRVRIAHGSIIVTVLALTVGAWLTYNYARWDTVSGVPLDKHIELLQDPLRLEKIKDGLFDIDNIPTLAAAYLSPVNVAFEKVFPWIFMTTTNPIYAGARIDNHEPSAGLPATTPALLLLALMGGGLLVRNRTPLHSSMVVPLVGAVATAVVMLMTGAISQRYTVEFVPLLALGGSMGVGFLVSLANRRTFVAAAMLLSLLGLYSVWANVAVSLEHQRDWAWDVAPQYQNEYYEWQRKADGVLREVWPPW